MWVAERKHIATANGSADYETSVPDARLVEEYVCDFKIVFNLVSKLNAIETLCPIEVVHSTMLLVKLVSQLLKKQDCIGVDARVLPLVDNRLEDLFYICHVEIAA